MKVNLLHSIFRFKWFIALFVVVLGIFITNYIPGTYLTGWDNLQTELYPWLAVQRAFFASWQEYQGLGLPAGMAHASDLIRAIFVWMLSFILPPSIIRYFFHHLMLLAGGWGMFVLLQSLGFNKEKTPFAFVGSVFYLLNLGTIQLFFLPYEPFSIFFAVLPWQLWIFTQILTREKPKWLMFLVINILATSVFYVQTLFVVYLIILGALGVGIFIEDRSKEVLKKLVAVFLMLFVINAFWLLPQIYFLMTKQQVVFNSKINQMATEITYDQNLNKGNFSNFIQLEGFYYDLVNSDKNLLFASWKSHFNTLIPNVLPLFFASISFVGIFNRKRKHAGFLLILFLCAVALLSALFPFSFINELLRGDRIINQLFRSPFTKFIVPFSLLYSYLLASGLLVISRFLNTNKVFHSLKPDFSFSIFITVLIFYYSLPAFQGYYFSPDMKIEIPQSYFETINYFKSQDKNKRIALLPIDTYWGWYSYVWGYDGSGFIWYGIEQPIVSRTFDVWSAENENYYWELSQAIYSKDTAAIERVLTKYDVSYIIQDENLMSSTNPKSLFNNQIEELFAQIPTIAKLKTFDRISVYQHTNPSSESFVGLYQNVPEVNSDFTWLSTDQAYVDFGTYISSNESAGILYPYRSLFTKRSASEREFTTSETDTELQISANGHRFLLPKQESLVYDSAATGDLSSQSLTPCGEEKVSPDNLSLKRENAFSYLELNTYQKRTCLSFGVSNAEHREGYIVAMTSRHQTGRPILFSMINETAKHVELETYLPSATEWQTTYFILPPIAPDGLGYSFYISNDAIGRHESINDLARIRMYKLPYQSLMNVKSGFGTQSISSIHQIDSVVRHNPAWYTVSLNNTAPHDSVLVLNQAFNSGWVAVEKTKSFPYFKKLKDHVLINNWSNGWKIKALGKETKVIIFFLPQILEFVGFLLLPIPFLMFLSYTKKYD